MAGSGAGSACSRGPDSLLGLLPLFVIELLAVDRPLHKPAELSSKVRAFRSDPVTRTFRVVSCESTRSLAPSLDVANT